MESEKLISAGLSKLQAKAYALLIERGEITPASTVTALGVSRTNAYKLYDKLIELGLAKKISDKKSIYAMSSPLALANLVSEYRAEATAREEAVNNIMNSLLANYYKHNEQPAVEVVSGKQAVADAFRKQTNLDENIYFIRSMADIPLMGFDVMHEIRVAPSRRGLRRFAIMQDNNKAPVNYAGHKRSNLDITWVRQEDYNAPVEWSVTASSLLIVLYGSEPHAITIVNPFIAQAFLQLWHLLDSCLRAMPYYSSLPRTASA
jgi:hypothetical protein